MRYILIITLSFVVFFTASGQTTYYKGEWSRSGASYNYQAFLKLTIKGNAVDGEIIWKLITPDSSQPELLTYYTQRVGVTGIEKVSGTFDAKTRDLVFEGYEKIDLKDVIGLDRYSLKFSGNRRVIFGRTYSGGSWTGSFYAILADAAAAAEFKQKRAQVLTQ